jgi:bifunctional ADP-heptose synthase (sugar kinase/adenylyltransferase)
VIEKFYSAKVLVIGDVMLDRYLYPDFDTWQGIIFHIAIN